MNIDFIFDGEKLSDYGYMICSFDSVGLETSTISEINFTEIKSPLSDISHKVATGYESNLSRTIQIMKMNCDDTNNYDNDNKDISTLTKWLCRKDYKWFQWIKDGVVEEIYYEVRINLKQIKLSDSSIGFELDIISNRPYGLSEEKVIEIDNDIIDTATGDVICVDNSSDNLMIDITLFGKSVQNTYSGKNLLENIRGNVVSYGGVTFTKNSDGSVTVVGTSTTDVTEYYVKGNWTNTENILPLESGSFISSGTGTSNILQFIVKNSGAIAGSSNGSDITFTVKEGGINGVLFRVPNGATVNATTLYPMIRLASITDDTYEPYVGGEASPNPSYPQDIVSVADDGDLVVKSCGKNLFNASDIYMENTIINPEGVLTENEAFDTYRYDVRKADYVSFSYEKDTNYDIFRFALEVKGVISRSATDKTSYTVSTKYADYLYISIAENTVLNLQVEYGTEVTEYEPYVGSQAELVIDTLGGLKVSEGGNYTDANGQQWICDTVNLRTGKRIQRICEMLVTSSNINSVSNGRGYINLYNKAKPNSDVLCTHYAGVKSLGTGWTVYFEDEVNCADTDTFKAFLDENDIKVCYPMLTPIETDLTEEQLTELRKLYSYEEYTTVYTDDIGDIGIQYYKNPSSIAVHNVNLDSDDEGYIYPDAVITVNESGNLIITNKFENRITRINNCKAGEIITFIGGGTLQITSNNALHDLSTDFNYNFIRLCNKYGNSDNIFTANLDCDIQLNFREKRKVGI